jgi:2-keto-4-pentenoate hydratase/2-oxohepta-3-ene-1,7-dioic acid hydratase in catechol pathway
MKLITFSHGGHVRIGAVRDAGVVDFAAAAPGLPRNMKAFLAAGEEAWQAARAAAAEAEATLTLDAVRLEAPIPDPGKILAIGLNYADHVAESGVEAPKHQIWFNKQANTVAGPADPILIPAVAPDFVDYEAELALVIGKRCRHVPAERAHEVIFGYTCGNDVSVRDWQLRTPQFTLGKSFASHAPLGPWLVSADEFGDPHDKGLRCYVNDEERQRSNTRHLIFDCFAQIAELSAAFALEPGDVIFTGTPGGVGAAMQPRRFLAPGDRVRVEIDGIGALENVCAVEDKCTVIG